MTHEGSANGTSKTQTSRFTRIPTDDLRTVIERARAGQYPEHALLVELSPPEAATENPDSSFPPPHQTTSRHALNPSALAAALGLRGDSPVHLCKKSGRNPFAGMITIGRAPNNDVVVPHSSVSKFHAYLRPTGESFALHDVGSTNGTRIEQTTLKIEGVPLGSPARLEFGHRAFLYIARADVRRWLNEQIA